LVTFWQKTNKHGSVLEDPYEAAEHAVEEHDLEEQEEEEDQRAPGLDGS
jgi:hypothetical protein